ISGMSMNPARTLGSAVPAMVWTALWVYFIAPPVGMLLAAELHPWLLGRQRVFCAKLQHDSDRPCIFCEYQASGRGPERGGR
ncbi:MAG: aquaporin, partial [Gemmatimonadales bacterium]